MYGMNAHGPPPPPVQGLVETWEIKQPCLCSEHKASHGSPLPIAAPSLGISRSSIWCHREESDPLAAWALRLIVSNRDSALTADTSTLSASGTVTTARQKAPANQRRRTATRRSATITVPRDSGLTPGRFHAPRNAHTHTHTQTHTRSTAFPSSHARPAHTHTHTYTHGRPHTPRPADADALHTYSAASFPNDQEPEGGSGKRHKQKATLFPTCSLQHPSGGETQRTLPGRYRCSALSAKVASPPRRVMSMRTLACLPAARNSGTETALFWGPTAKPPLEIALDNPPSSPSRFSRVRVSANACGESCSSDMPLLPSP